MPGKWVSFSLGYFSFTPGILPCALRASFAVRARSCVRRGQAEEKYRPPREDESSCSRALQVTNSLEATKTSRLQLLPV
jgi:hypothetical protein